MLFFIYTFLLACICINNCESWKFQGQTPKFSVFLRSKGSQLKVSASRTVNGIVQNSENNNEVEATSIKLPIHNHENSIKKCALAGSAVLASIFLLQNPSHASTVLESFQEKATSSGFIQSFLLVFVSEIGDKTFFIAALLAAKYGRFISFTGSIGALGVMTIISTVIGQLFHAVSFLFLTSYMCIENF